MCYNPEGKDRIISITIEELDENELLYENEIILSIVKQNDDTKNQG